MKIPLCIGPKGVLQSVRYRSKEEYSSIILHHLLKRTFGMPAGKPGQATIYAVVHLCFLRSFEFLFEFETFSK